MPTNWTDQVSNAISNLETNTDRVLEPARALAILDDVVEGKLAAYELAIIHGIPEALSDTSRGWFRARAASCRSTPAAGMPSRGMSSLTRWPPVSPPPGRRRAACRDRTAHTFLPCWGFARSAASLQWRRVC